MLKHGRNLIKNEIWSLNWKRNPWKIKFWNAALEVSKLVIFAQLLNLCNSGEQNIILCENNNIINDAKEVSENFNSFFSTVADKIGQNVVYDPSTHPSIVEIKNHVDIDNNFDFQNITAERVEKIINTINIKKLQVQITFLPK